MCFGVSKSQTSWVDHQPNNGKADNGETWYFELWSQVHQLSHFGRFFFKGGKNSQDDFLQSWPKTSYKYDFHSTYMGV